MKTQCHAYCAIVNSIESRKQEKKKHFDSQGVDEYKRVRERERQTEEEEEQQSKYNVTAIASKWKSLVVRVWRHPGKAIPIKVMSSDLN